MRRPSTLREAIGVLCIVGIAAGCGPAASAAPSASAGTAASSAPPSSESSAPSAAPSIAPAAVLWPIPSDPMARTTAAGLTPGPKEYLINHVHSHLDVFVDGAPITVPGGIGINITNPDVKTFDEPGGKAYGGIEMCAAPCISPLHTHDVSGIIHTESRTQQANTLGQFFTEWGVELSESCVGGFCNPKPLAFYVDGKPYTANPRDIPLTDGRVIVVVVGTPPAQIPTTADFSGA